MKNTTITRYRQLVGSFVALMTVTLLSPMAWADFRQEAHSAISRLRQPDIAGSMPEEVRSAEITFATAEHYFTSNDSDQSERYYLLTLQKARVILASRTDNTSPAAVPPLPTVPREESPPVVEQPVTPTAPEPEVAVTPATIPEPEVAVHTTPEPQDLFSDDVVSEKLVGHPSVYTVVEKDTLRLVAAKLGVSRQHIITANKLDAKAFLKVGQKLRYNNRKIVPQRMKDGIVVNIPDRTLYYFKKGKLTVSIPVALGVAVKTEKYDWKTPTGKFKITAKAKDPTWYVPPSIQSEMEDQGKEVITSIPPGPQNPLGKFAIKTSIPGILIHSTTKPWSIYSFASHGCIRVYPEQMEELFKEISVNTPGEIIYRPVKLAVTEQGRVFLEVHQDIYGKSTAGLAQEARAQIEKQKLTERVDWKKVETVLRQKAGIAEDISL